MGLGWLLEQPGSSQMEWHPRFSYMIRCLPQAPEFCFLPQWFVLLYRTLDFKLSCNHSSCLQVYRSWWWMKSYGSLTPKRHLGYSNCRVVEKLYLGYLTKRGQTKIFKKKGKSKVSTTRRYKDRRGRMRFSGTPYLKKSQYHPELLVYRSPVSDSLVGVLSHSLSLLFLSFSLSLSLSFLSLSLSLLFLFSTSPFLYAC